MCAKFQESVVLNFATQDRKCACLPMATRMLHSKYEDRAFVTFESEIGRAEAQHPPGIVD
jgi:hypothetical protein